MYEALRAAGLPDRSTTKHAGALTMRQVLGCAVIYALPMLRAEDGWRRYLLASRVTCWMIRAQMGGALGAVAHARSQRG